jgi:carboxymethylenebutenolidase
MREVASKGWAQPLPVLRVGAGDRPPVVLVPHRDGVDEFVRATAARVAEAGFTTYVPDVYHGQWSDLPPRERKARLTDALLLADLTAVADLVAADGHGDRPAVLGFCMGGRIAALAAVATDRYRLAISCYGGDLDKPWGDPSTVGPLGMVHPDSAPVDFHCGRSDTNPAPATVRAMAAALHDAGVPAAVHEYDAGHAFCNQLREDVYRPEAAAAAWQRILARLGETA